jgi:TPP-dependent pyruvate/acetoin dehydrogenase alpha subunit
MYIKEVNNERFVVHCAYRSTEECVDWNNPLEKVKQFAIEQGIKEISSGICESCAKIMEEEIDNL